MPLKVIITGATGMVGEGVLHECLLYNDVEAVLVVGRKSCGAMHPKLKEIVHPDFYNLSPIANQLTGYDTCFFCLGISSVGLDETEYYKRTYTLTIHFAEILAARNPDMIFSYISGMGTDSSEKGKLNWARVKGKTENDLMKLPFKKVFAFRPGFLSPTKGLKNTKSYYKYFNWLFPLLRTLFPNSTSSLSELGLAMIHSAQKGYEKSILEVKDILALTKD
jgi:uncharacterized protein YbjT (DUF2867 family)